MIWSIEYMNAFNTHPFARFNSHWALSNRLNMEISFAEFLPLTLWHNLYEVKGSLAVSFYVLLIKRNLSAAAKVTTTASLQVAV